MKSLQKVGILDNFALDNSLSQTVPRDWTSHAPATF